MFFLGTLCATIRRRLCISSHLTHSAQLRCANTHSCVQIHSCPVNRDIVVWRAHPMTRPRSGAVLCTQRNTLSLRFLNDLILKASPQRNRLKYLCRLPSLTKSPWILDPCAFRDTTPVEHCCSDRPSAWLRQWGKLPPLKPQTPPAFFLSAWNPVPPGLDARPPHTREDARTQPAGCI